MSNHQTILAAAAAFATVYIVYSLSIDGLWSNNERLP